MKINKPIYLIIALSLLFTVIIHLDLTRAIIFENYMNNRQISGVNYYLSLINESSKGNWRLGSPYIMEWSGRDYLYPALNVNAAGLFKRMLGLNIKSYAMITGYVAVFLIMSLILTVFSYIFNFSYLGYLAATDYIFFPRAIVWDRTLSPEINFIPFALFLIIYFSQSSFWKREIGLAVSAGILFYIYPYYWTFALALLGVSDLHEFWKQNRIILKNFYKYFIIAGISSWYVAHLWHLYQLPYYQESLVRIGFINSRFPAGWFTQIVLILSLVLFFVLKRYVPAEFKSDFSADESWNKILAGLMAGLFVLNQQIITGIQMEFNSHYAPIILIFLIAFFGKLFYNLALRAGSYRIVLIGGYFVLAISLAAVRAYSISANFGLGGYIGGRADEVVGWFLDKKIKNAVVYAPENIGDEINLWTDNYLVWNDNQALQLMPNDEVVDRFTYFDITNQNITENLFDRQTAFLGQTYIASQQKDNVINKIISKISGKKFVPATLEEYATFDFGSMREKRIKRDFKEFSGYLERYHVNYLVYRKDDGSSIYGGIPGEIVFDGELYIIKEL